MVSLPDVATFDRVSDKFSVDRVIRVGAIKGVLMIDKTDVDLAALLARKF